MTITVTFQEALLAVTKASVLAGNDDVSANLKALLDNPQAGTGEAFRVDAARSTVAEAFFELQARAGFPIGLSAWYAFDKTLRIYHRESLADFTYSDGDEVEDRILNAVKDVEQVNLHSAELRERQVDWPSEYHLSADRANLLRPFANQLAFG